MHIPGTWFKATTKAQLADGRVFPLTAWGWGDSENQARKLAEERLRRLSDRIRRGDPFPGGYEYASRPIREEILQTIDDGRSGQATAMITRNRYGAQIMNTSTLLFLDVDLKPVSFVSRLLRIVRGNSASVEEETLGRLRNALGDYGRATFRIYRTAAGFRAVAIDRKFDPAKGETQELMEATGTDPAFRRLCVAQRCFRARLTPKPWRCECELPPGDHPRADEEERAFAAWQRSYEDVIRSYSTCAYIETVGNGRMNSAAAKLLPIHDRITRCDEPLPLA